MKVLIAMSLVFLQLALQVGVPVHKHFCEMDGVFTSVVLKIDHECKEQQEANQLPPCCRAAQEKACETQVSQDDCCSDELEVIKTNLDQNLSQGLDLNLPIEFIALPFKAIYPTQLVALSKHLNPSQTFYRPPPLFECGRDLQTLHQVWRI
ncbi:MAG: HYC_CC_PP family protein [Flavobacteriales bacterium]